MAFPEKLGSQFYEGRDFCFHGNDPFRQICLGRFEILGFVDGQKLPFQKHRLINTFVEYGELVEKIHFPFTVLALHEDESLVAMKDPRQFIVVLF